MGLKNFLIDIGMPVPEKYHTKPQGHETYTWVSQDGSVTRAADLDDNHLLNIYILLNKSIDMMRELIQNTYPRHDAIKLLEETEELKFMEHNFAHIAYETYRRNLYVRRHDLYQVPDGIYKDD